MKAIIVSGIAVFGAGLATVADSIEVFLVCCVISSITLLYATIIDAKNEYKRLKEIEEGESDGDKI